MPEKKMTDAITMVTLGAAPVPPVKVPWDVQALKGRECRTCACYFEQANTENLTQIQGFCRRLPAELAEVRMMEQRRDLQGRVVMKDGHPVMQPGKVTGFLYKPTRPEGTCYDGWRPVDTLPGERSIDTHVRQARDRLQPLLAEIPPNLRPFLAALFGIEDLVIDANAREQ